MCRRRSSSFRIRDSSSVVVAMSFPPSRGPEPHGRERFLDERLVAPLCLLPRLEVRPRTLRQHAVAYDKVGRIAEEMEIGKGALRLLDHHLLEVEDEPHRALLFVG